jgi:hypothetical protein
MILWIFCEKAKQRGEESSARTADIGAGLRTVPTYFSVTTCGYAEQIDQHATHKLQTLHVFLRAAQLILGSQVESRSQAPGDRCKVQQYTVYYP